MAWQSLQYNLKSSAPLIMHSSRLADPLNRFAKEIKKISSKRIKTDSDYEEMARIEFIGGLYLSEDGPIIPAHVIEATLINAAKRSKEGTLAKSAVFCAEHASLRYDGPRTADELWADERFRHVASVRVGNARVMRTRAIFSTWECVVELSVDTSLVNSSRVDEWMKVAGTQIGVCEWRPRFGRFQASRL